MCNVPCHTQLVERMTTECAGAFAGAQNPFNVPQIFYKHMEFSVKAFAKHIYVLIKTHQSLHVL